MLIHLLVFPRPTVARLSVHACTLLVLQQAGMIVRPMTRWEKRAASPRRDQRCMQLHYCSNARHGRQYPRPTPLQQNIRSSRRRAIARTSIYSTYPASHLYPSISLSISKRQPASTHSLSSYDHHSEDSIYSSDRTYDRWASILDQLATHGHPFEAKHTVPKIGRGAVACWYNGTCIDDEQE